MSRRILSCRGRRRALSKTLGLALVAAALLYAHPRDVVAQFSAPCKAACALVLGVSSYAVGTSATVAWGRQTGGLSTANEGKWVWASGFALALGGGVALSGNGERQERAVYGAGLGVLAGAAVGLLVGSLRSEGSRVPRLADTLIGAGAGALIGGIYGAISHDADTDLFALASPRVTLLTLAWGL